ncbi:TetR/AcrR family transcriptional regulator [Streptomyces sp. NBC_01795]|uniref:TetR/AcrR family transcriptional regulator n=1 Tax=unclassified Streptomyces TaxID=2593676 RepID=UPI002DD9D55C|nr:MULTISPECIES: TetR/AcrR family transcriptional regulator [unclassified Streptomyces]WSA96789.1 TetR/AcrR family transcriptional regulator [Streptomyces sp. NBC_01795]WSS10588.1 TetR/AcrR family transcriptional regulator [Streptomyces sp. NBC_01186]
MARVSPEHLEARRRQILDGARRSFLHNGFHATSMQDVLKETGLSAGAVYRYFRSKEEIVAVVAVEALDTIRASFDRAVAAEVPLRPDELFTEVFGRLEQSMGVGEDRRELPRLLLQVWGEALRNPELGEVVAEAYAHLGVQWARVVEEYQAQGWVDPEADTVHVARALIGSVQGYFVQQALFGGFTPEEFAKGLRALVSMSLPDARGQEAGPG